MQFSAVIIDDEPLAIEGLRRLCMRSGKVDIVGDADNGAEGIKLVESLQPNALFLDISMPGLNGLGVAAGVRSLRIPPLVVFVSAFDHFASQAFDLSAVEYVTKPLEPARLGRAIDRLEALLHSDEDDDHKIEKAMWVPSRDGMVRVPLSTIQRIDAERDYVRLSVGDRTFLLRETISAIEAKLDPDIFIRVHRSTILRIANITRIRHLGAGTWSAIDAAGQQDRIGRSYLQKVRKQLGCGTS